MFTKPLKDEIKSTSNANTGLSIPWLVARWRADLSVAGSISDASNVGEEKSVHTGHPDFAAY